MDARTPNLARAYDYLLGGSANFTADRALAGRLLTLCPGTRDLLSISRTHLADSVAQAARGGVDQFVDIGSGLPTWPSVHEAARGQLPGARVVYVDRDPAVVAHAAPGVPAGVRVIEGDLAEPEALLWALRPLADLARPACLVLAMVLQTLEVGTARAVTGVLIRALAPGSRVVITIGEGDSGRLPDAAGAQALSAADMESFLGGLDPLPPGVRRMTVAGNDLAGDDLAVLCAVGRKP